MHPVIKIISLIILSVYITQGGWLTLLFTGALVLPFYVYKPSLWKSARIMIWRLKWLFLSILLIYLFFTPKLSSTLTQLNPYLYLLLPGLFRVLVLINLILAVNLLIKTTSKDEILTALLWIFFPLSWFHIDIDRFLLRAVLSIEYIELLNLKLSEIKLRDLKLTDIKEGVKSEEPATHWLYRKKQALYQLVDTSNEILHELFIAVAQAEQKEYLITALEQPRWLQWGIPVLLLLFLSIVSYI